MYKNLNGAGRRQVLQVAPVAIPRTIFLIHFISLPPNSFVRTCSLTIHVSCSGYLDRVRTSTPSPGIGWFSVTWELDESVLSPEAQDGPRAHITLSPPWYVGGRQSKSQTRTGVVQPCRIPVLFGIIQYQNVYKYPFHHYIIYIYCRNKIKQWNIVGEKINRNNVSEFQEMQFF